MYFSINRFTGDGITTQWEFNFSGGYIDQAHVKVLVIDPSGVETIPTHTWVGPNTISIVPAVASGSTLEVYRDTPKNLPLVDYTDGAIVSEKNLDTTAEQSVFVAAEVFDRFLDTENLVVGAATAATEAAELATVVAGTAALDASAAQVSASNAAGSAAASQAALENIEDEIDALIGGDYSDFLRGVNNLSDVTNAPTARINLGLGNVDNTSDVAKPVSTAQSAAIAVAAQGVIDTLTAANGSNIVGFQQAGAGAVARTSQDKMRAVVDVRDFGAVCDGVTDDASAAQKALDYAASIGAALTSGGAVCAIGARLAVTGAPFALRDLRLKAIAPLSVELVLATNCADVSVSECVFDAASIAYSWIKFEGVNQRINITGCKFSEVKATGTCFGLWLKGCSDTIISGNIFKGADAATSRMIYISSATGACKGIVISRNVFEDVTSSGADGDAIVCEDYYETGNSVVVSNNVFRNIHKRAVKAGGSNWVISGNLLDGVSATYANFSFYGASNFTLIDNISINPVAVIDAFVDIGSGASPHVANVHVSGNKVSFPVHVGPITQDMISIKGPTSYLRVENNVIDNCRYFAYKQDGHDLFDAVFSGNVSTACRDHEFSFGSGVNSNITIENHKSVLAVASRALASFSGTDSDIRIIGCSFDKSFGLIAGLDRPLEAWGNVISGSLDTASVFRSGKVHGRRSTDPASGTYEIGDIFFHSVPTPGGFLGWVCTAGGTPGTWKGFGAIAT